MLGKIIVGVTGAVPGGFLFGLPGISASGLTGSIITATAGAALLLFVIGIVRKAWQYGKFNQADARIANSCYFD